MQYLLSNISKKVGALVKWRGAFWERRYSAQPLLDEDALLDKVRYVLAHGVKEGLVRRCSEWPGLSALPLMQDGKPTDLSVDELDAPLSERTRRHVVVLASTTAGRNPRN